MQPKIFMSYKSNPSYYADAIRYCDGICCGGYLQEITAKTVEEHDGLLLCGGPDVHPRYYGEDINGTKTIDEARDIYELSLIDKFVQAKKPILGICRGHQILNIYFGGSLIQDLSTGMLHTAENDIVHVILSESDSTIASLFGNRFSVNSAHHQAIKRPGIGLRITHYSEEDHAAEAMEHESLPIFSVQWHPERMTLQKRRSDTVDGLPIFQHFINLCG